MPVNKQKIINDPVHGFIKIPSDLVYDLIEHPILQRLRRIKQLGLTDFVYPGATHSRFQHTLGAVYLTVQAINNLRLKDIEISKEEEEGALIAILLHDIGHGPYSHALENYILSGIDHEDISLYLMQKLNEEYDGKLDLAIKIFKNEYAKKFLHELVSSQLDMDRMDYLKRDSFYTGVTEGIIGSDRIIKMLNVKDDKLVVEKKGIYSIEKFLIARRLMYWQVYFHKTVIAAEYLMVNLIRRARFLIQNNADLFTPESLRFFLEKEIDKTYFENNKALVIQNFLNLDDTDIIMAAKQWSSSTDKVLYSLANSYMNRKLPKVLIQDKAFSKQYINKVTAKTALHYNISEDDARFLITSDEIANNAYSQNTESILILKKDGKTLDIADASDVINFSYLYKMVKKYFICIPEIAANEDYS